MLLTIPCHPLMRNITVILETLEHLNQATLCLDGTCMGDRLGAHSTADKSQSKNLARFETRRQQGLFTAESQLKSTPPLVICIHNIN